MTIHQPSPAGNSADDAATTTTAESSTVGTAANSEDDRATAHANPTGRSGDESTLSMDTPTDEALFAESELPRLRSRWDDVQSNFVDDPRGCVQKADALVSEVVEQLTTGFAEARSRLEAQWARGEETSTEDLRVALKRYREFFQRLIAV